jgi:hypothetical protein
MFDFGGKPGDWLDITEIHEFISAYMNDGHEVHECDGAKLFLHIRGKWVEVIEKDYKTFCQCWHKEDEDVKKYGEGAMGNDCGPEVEDTGLSLHVIAHDIQFGWIGLRSDGRWIFSNVPGDSNMPWRYRDTIAEAIQAIVNEVLTNLPEIR